MGGGGCVKGGDVPISRPTRPLKRSRRHRLRRGPAPPRRRSAARRIWAGDNATGGAAAAAATTALRPQTMHMPETGRPPPATASTTARQWRGAAEWIPPRGEVGHPQPQKHRLGPHREVRGTAVAIYLACVWSRRVRLGGALPAASPGCAGPALSSHRSRHRFEVDGRWQATQPHGGVPPRRREPTWRLALATDRPWKHRGRRLLSTPPPLSHMDGPQALDRAGAGI